MQELRDISGVPGVAQPKSATQTDDLSRARAAALADPAEFANPTQNLHQIGIAPGMKVADFGAGSGAYTLGAARAVGKGGRVYAVDVQKDLLSRIKNAAAKEKLENVEIVWADFEHLGGTRLASHSLDVVILSNTLFQLEHRLGAFHEACRVLKPTGKLAVIDWTESFGGMGPQKRDVVNCDEAESLAKSAGFVCVKNFPAGAHHYGLLCTPVAS